MNKYAERDARKVIPLVSDDGGVTWHPRGNPNSIYREAGGIKIIRLKSVDGGLTWKPV